MSEVRLNILDRIGTINGTVHGSVADAIVAALSAEPETIAELEAALGRFIKPLDDQKPFSLFHGYANEQAWDAGIVIVDLAARIVAAESSYSVPQARGEVGYHDGSQATEVCLPYRVPDDWLFVASVDEYHVSRDEHRRCRAEPLDPRPILYGPAMTEFIVKGCLAAREAKADSPFHSTIAHGFLSLSLLPHLAAQALKVQGDFKMGINYGLNRLRFVSPVPAGSRIRARFTLQSVEDVTGGIQLAWSVLCETEGGHKPALVAEWLVR